MWECYICVGWINHSPDLISLSTDCAKSENNCYIFLLNRTTFRFLVFLKFDFQGIYWTRKVKQVLLFNWWYLLLKFKGWNAVTLQIYSLWTMAPNRSTFSPYPGPCWLIINEVLWRSPQVNFAGYDYRSIIYMNLKNIKFNIIATLPIGQCVKANIEHVPAVCDKRGHEEVWNKSFYSVSFTHH